MPSYPTAQRTARLQVHADAIDSGSGAGYAEVYSGTVPANVGTSITSQTKLATLTFSDPCGSVTSGVLTMSAITQDSSADASGTPSFVRSYSSDGTVRGQYTAGVGSGEVNFGAAIVSGQPVQITSWTITEGNA